MLRRLMATCACALFAVVTVLTAPLVSATPLASTVDKPHDVTSVAATPAGGGPLDPTSSTPHEGIIRLSGGDRYATAAKIAESWPIGVQTVFIASGETYADALSAAARAGAEKAPLLLTRSTSVPGKSAAALNRLRPQRIVIVGGTTSVSAAVADRLAGYATSGQVVRLGGNSHYDTSIAVSQLYPSKVSTVYLASGEDYPDALAGAALAGHRGAPLLLTRKAELSSAARVELRRLAPQQIVVLGGPMALSESVLRAAAPLSGSPIRRIAGPNRYYTAAAVADEFAPTSGGNYVASGHSFADALVGAAASARDGAPLLLTPKDQVHPETARVLSKQQPKILYALGGKTVIYSSTMTSLAQYLPGARDVIWRDKFDAAASGRLDTQAKGDALFAPTAVATTRTTYGNGSIVNDGEGGKLLRHTIAGGELGKFIVSPMPTTPTDHAVLEYELRFDEDFDWRWGGKMGPGLVGWAPGYGPYDATSGQSDRNVGFSTRLMWHGRGDDGSRPFQGALGPIPREDVNDVVAYVYARDPQKGFSGYGWHSSFGEMLPGVWHKIRMEVKLNTVGSTDGVFEIHINDRLVFSESNWDYRNTGKVRIRAILWDVHRGGGLTRNWVSSRESHIDVRNVTLTDLAP